MVYVQRKYYDAKTPSWLVRSTMFILAGSSLVSASLPQLDLDSDGKIVDT